MNETQSQSLASAVAGADLNTADLRPVDADLPTRSAPSVLLDGNEIKIESVRDVPQDVPGEKAVIIPVNVKKRPRNTHQTRLASPLIEKLIARSPACQEVSQHNRDWEVLKGRVDEYGDNQVKMHDAINGVKAIAAEIPGFTHSPEFQNAEAVYDQSVTKTAPIYNELADAVEKRSGNVKIVDEADYLNLADRTMTQLTEQTTIYAPISIIVHDEMHRIRVFKEAQDAAAADPSVVTDVEFKEVSAEQPKA